MKSGVISASRDAMMGNLHGKTKLTKFGAGVSLPFGSMPEGSNEESEQGLPSSFKFAMFYVEARISTYMNHYTPNAIQKEMQAEDIRKGGRVKSIDIPLTGNYSQDLQRRANALQGSIAVPGCNQMVNPIVSVEIKNANTLLIKKPTNGKSLDEYLNLVCLNDERILKNISWTDEGIVLGNIGEWSLQLAGDGQGVRNHLLIGTSKTEIDGNAATVRLGKGHNSAPATAIEGMDLNGGFEDWTETSLIDRFFVENHTDNVQLRTLPDTAPENKKTTVQNIIKDIFNESDGKLKLPTNTLPIIPPSLVPPTVTLPAALVGVKLEYGTLTVNKDASGNYVVGYVPGGTAPLKIEYIESSDDRTWNDMLTNILNSTEFAAAPGLTKVPVIQNALDPIDADGSIKDTIPNTNITVGGTPTAFTYEFAPPTLNTTKLTGGVVTFEQDNVNNKVIVTYVQSTGPLKIDYKETLTGGDWSRAKIDTDVLTQDEFNPQSDLYKKQGRDEVIQFVQDTGTGGIAALDLTGITPVPAGAVTVTLNGTPTTTFPIDITTGQMDVVRTTTIVGGTPTHTYTIAYDNTVNPGNLKMTYQENTETTVDQSLTSADINLVADTELGAIDTTIASAFSSFSAGNMDTWKVRSLEYSHKVAFKRFMKYSGHLGEGNTGTVDIADYNKAWEQLEIILTGETDFDAMRIAGNADDQKKMFIVDRFKQVFAIEGYIRGWGYTQESGKIKNVMGKHGNGFETSINGPDGTNPGINVGACRDDFESVDFHPDKDESFKKHNNIFGFTAFYGRYSGVNAGATGNNYDKYSATAMGATTIMQYEDGGVMKECKKRLVDESAEALADGKDWFGRQLEKTPGQADMFADNILKMIQTKGFNITNLTPILKNPSNNYQELREMLADPTKTIDFLDATTNKTVSASFGPNDLDYIFYLLGECANESVGIEIHGMTIKEKEVTEKENLESEAEYKNEEVYEGNSHDLPDEVSFEGERDPKSKPGVTVSSGVHVASMEVNTKRVDKTARHMIKPPIKKDEPDTTPLPPPDENNGDHGGSGTETTGEVPPENNGDDAGEAVTETTSSEDVGDVATELEGEASTYTEPSSTSEPIGDVATELEGANPSTVITNPIVVETPPPPPPPPPPPGGGPGENNGDG